MNKKNKLRAKNSKPRKKQTGIKRYILADQSIAKKTYFAGEIKSSEGFIIFCLIKQESIFSIDPSKGIKQENNNYLFLFLHL
ncbi:MAG: hypothetical protein CSB55_09080 [Candidatus Cloacimonadota bacterium]|nr:MAG: hypothetical protein CSB55_09080 [Candidatus Cloacimonadota bacterium]